MGAGLVASLAAFFAAAGPAAAEICDLKVYNSSFFVRGDESDQYFEKGDQFILCFTARKDGYVSLWDQSPQNGQVERLGPSPKFEKSKARKVSAGETRCFGDGEVEEGGQPYALLMEAQDGYGLGRMWLVFSESVGDHPDDQVFNSPMIFANSYDKRLGAGAIAIDPELARKAEGRTDAARSTCAKTGSLDYNYRVVKDKKQRR